MPVNDLPSVSLTTGRPVLPLLSIGRPGINDLPVPANLNVTRAIVGPTPPHIAHNTTNSLNAWSLWLGPPIFGHPAITHIPRFMNIPQLRAGHPYFSDPHLGMYYPGAGDMRGLPAEPTPATPYYRVVNAIWPDLLNRRAVISPARNGVNRSTGKVLQGWEHVEQSMFVIFQTPFHERILRRWVGSYVPYILGETYVARIVTRFFWAIAVSIDLWEPNYRIKQVHYMGEALAGWAPRTLDAVGEYRLGHGIFRTEGVYRPRAHLGDPSPYSQRAVGLVGGGTEIWDPAVAGI
jgi:uncharacterized protein